jgi:hypothetical protein
MDIDCICIIETGYGHYTTGSERERERERELENTRKSTLTITKMFLSGCLPVCLSLIVSSREPQKKLWKIKVVFLEELAPEQLIHSMSRAWIESKKTYFSNTFSVEILQWLFIMRSWDSVVRLNDWRLGVWVPAEFRLFSFTCGPERLWGSSNGYQSLFPQVGE